MNFRKRTNIPVLIIAVTAMVHLLSGTALCGGSAENAKKKFPPSAGRNHVMPEGGAFFKPAGTGTFKGNSLECATLPAGNYMAGPVALPGNSNANNALIAQSLAPNAATFNPAAFNTPAPNNPLATPAPINQAIASSLAAPQNDFITAYIGSTFSLNNSMTAAIQNPAAISADVNAQNNLSSSKAKDTSKSVSSAMTPALEIISASGSVASFQAPAQISPTPKTLLTDIRKVKTVSEAASFKRTFIQINPAKNISASKSAGAIFNRMRSRTATIADSLKDILACVNQTRKTAINAAIRKQLEVIAGLKKLLPLLDAYKDTLKNNISSASAITMSKAEDAIAALRHLPETFSRFIRNKMLPIVRIIKDRGEILFSPTADNKGTGLPYHALPMEQYPSDPAANRITDTDSGSNNNCSIVISRTIINDILARKALFSAPSQTIQAVNYSRTGLSPPAKNLKTSSFRVSLSALYPHAGNKTTRCHVFDRITSYFNTSYRYHSFSDPTTSLLAARRILSLNIVVPFEHKGIYIRMGGFFCFTNSGSQALGSAREEL